MSKSQKKSKQVSKPKIAYYKKDSNFPERPIADNSHKYDISSESEEEAPDFNYLLSQQKSAGSHFLLKSEQEKYQNDQQGAQLSKHFNIDIKSLNLAIKSIPFYERHIISGIDWSEEELNQMREEARVHEEAYRELIKANESKVSEQRLDKVNRKVEKLSVDPVKEESPKEVIEESPKDEKKSMEKWLDDILDI